jgi:hypothetical protein
MVVSKSTLLRLVINMTTWTAQALMDASQGMAIHKNMQALSNKLDPGKVETKLNWYTWEEKFKNYLAAHIGSATVPLDYLVRRDKEDNWDPDVDAATEHEKRQCQMILSLSKMIRLCT